MGIRQVVAMELDPREPFLAEEHTDNLLRQWAEVECLTPDELQLYWALLRSEYGAD